MGTSWQVSGLATACEGAGVVGCAAVALGPATDPAGRLLLGLAALALLGLTARDGYCRPVLAAGPDGLRVRSGWRVRTVAWQQVARMRVVTDRRTPVLEIDLGDDLVVLTRHRLGVPPAAAWEVLETYRPRRSS